MRLTGHPTIKFDTFSPIYNWIYPVGGVPSKRFVGSAAADVFHEVRGSQSRALYVHIPFCDTICSFCPFVRAARHKDEEVSTYVDALVREIELKAKFPGLAETPIGAVFFGGGTPSVLSPKQIRKIGAALRSHFDLSTCREFSFEFEVKTVTDERIVAARDIGVSHARFGAQTFVPAFRDYFQLSASVETVRQAAALLRTAFPHSSCDVLYGMHGQTDDDLQFDIDQACALELPNLDFYPLNNLVTQPKLSKDFADDGRHPTSGLTKHYMGIFVREVLRDRGYLPHNGHGFVRTDLASAGRPPILTAEYSFVYHEHTLGYPDFDLLGFGVNAVSSFSGYSVSNIGSKRDYVSALLDEARLPVMIAEHTAEVDACRALALALPYHGEIPTKWVNTKLVPDDVLQRLECIIDHGLVAKTPTTLALTEDGLAWYANLMFYLSPASERAALASVLRGAMRDSRRMVEVSGLEGIDLRGQVPLAGL